MQAPGSPKRMPQPKIQFDINKACNHRIESKSVTNHILKTLVPAFDTIIGLYCTVTIPSRAKIADIMAMLISSIPMLLAEIPIAAKPLQHHDGLIRVLRDMVSICDYTEVRNTALRVLARHHMDKIPDDVLQPPQVDLAYRADCQRGKMHPNSLKSRW
ncbi:hypothetical protein HDU76_007581 [Blyttiomyces sp. JEL0837]|nr:hypothetical protein HDU76_007581 [Blyttiomyces sp. JEL0837]